MAGSPYDETQEYVKQVLYFAGHKQPDPCSGGLDKPF